MPKALIRAWARARGHYGGAQTSTDCGTGGAPGGGHPYNFVATTMGGGISFGGDELHNYGSKPVVIDKITLSKASGLRLVEAVIVTRRRAYAHEVGPIADGPNGMCVTPSE